MTTTSTAGCTISRPTAAARYSGARDSISVLAEDVVRRFGDRVVLDHLRLEIPAAEFVVLLGPPGCGKTTLLRLLAGLDQPDAGELTVPRDRAIVFQRTRPLPWRRAVHRVKLSRRERSRGTARDQLRARLLVPRAGSSSGMT